MEQTPDTVSKKLTSENLKYGKGQPRIEDVLRRKFAKGGTRPRFDSADLELEKYARKNPDSIAAKELKRQEIMNLTSKFRRD